MSDDTTLPAFRAVPRTGVIYVTTEATRRGYRPGDPDWCNLGQGQPETGELPGAPPRVSSVTVDVDDQEYAPVAGLWELREAIAGLYNRLYRRGMPIAVHRRERLHLRRRPRRAHARRGRLGHINLGHFLPDYTAYEELLDIFKAFTAIPILLEGERGYAFTAEDLRREILGRGLSALLLSNPCNPTGKLVRARSWRAGWRVARELDCTLLLDEFYSHYIWTRPPRRSCPVESAARYVEDVDRDPGRHLRRPHQELALPGLAHDLDGGPAPGHRRGVAARAPSSTAAAPSRCSAPRSRCSTSSYVVAETLAIHDAFREKRDRLPLAPGAAGRPHRPRARRHLLRLGQRRRAARRRSTTAWASSAPRSSRRSSPCPASSST